MPDPVTTHPTPEQLTAYALGKLPDEQIAWVNEHLTSCATCRRVVDEAPPDSFLGQLKALDARRGTLPPNVSTPFPPARPTGPALADLPPELAASGKYQVLGKLGQGGMGAVYKARHTFLDELVAIKVMNPDLGANADGRSRFLREMKATAKLKHSNIVRAVDAEALGDHLILVMEYVEGVTLDRLVKQKGPLPVNYACRFVAQAALGLQHAHEQGMIHRDIKPANLMVTAKGKQVKVLDFGLARGPRDRQARTDQTQLQTFMGTPEYVAPEQATDAATADIRADVYSLGCTLFFLLTGRPPFQADTVMNILLAQIQDKPPSLAEARPDVPAGLVAVVAKLLAKAPKDRYQTPGEVAKALQPFLIAPKATPPSISRVAQAPTFAEDELSFVGAAAPSPRRQQKQTRPAWLVYGSAVLASVATVALLAWGVIVITTEDGRAEIEIKCNEPGGKVIIDGPKVKLSRVGGKDPITFRAVPGEYKIRVEKDGFETKTESFVYRNGGEKSFTVTIRPKASAKLVAVRNAKRFPIRLPAGWEKGWSTDGDELVQDGSGGNLWCFGDKEWRDYDFTVEAKKLHPMGWLFFAVRSQGEENQIRVAPGAWGDSYVLELIKDGKPLPPLLRLQDYKQNLEWYSVEIKVRGKRITAKVDRKLICDAEYEMPPQGGVGLLQWNTPCRFRNLKVTNPDGNVLLEGIPDL